MAGAHVPHGDPNRERGALESFLSLVGSFSSYLQARLELAGLEGREAGLRLIGFLFWLGLGIVLLITGYVFGVALAYYAVKSWFGLSNLWTSLIFLLAHILAAAIALLLAWARLKAPFFPHSIAQLAHDRAWLNRSQTPDAPKP